MDAPQHPATATPRQEPFPRAWSSLAEIAVILPAWQPGAQLITLVDELREAGLSRIIVVDDGSTPEHSHIFRMLASQGGGVTLCRHPANLGKGRALKTAFAFVLATWPGLAGVVTADADGQHLAPDIVRVARELAGCDRVVLGVRGFTGAVPLRSRFGNALTRAVFTLVTGCRLRDTQTGLRGIPLALLPSLLAVPGERYEYETATLAHLCLAGYALRQIPIETVYLDRNSGSHFNPLWDSLRILLTLARSALRRAAWLRHRTGPAEKPTFGAA